MPSIRPGKAGRRPAGPNTRQAPPRSPRGWEGKFEQGQRVAADSAIDTVRTPISSAGQEPMATQAHGHRLHNPATPSQGRAPGHAPAGSRVPKQQADRFGPAGGKRRPAPAPRPVSLRIIEPGTAAAVRCHLRHRPRTPGARKRTPHERGDRTKTTPRASRCGPRQRPIGSAAGRKAGAARERLAPSSDRHPRPGHPEIGASRPTYPERVLR